MRGEKITPFVFLVSYWGIDEVLYKRIFKTIEKIRLILGYVLGMKERLRLKDAMLLMGHV